MASLWTVSSPSVPDKLLSCPPYPSLSSAPVSFTAYRCAARCPPKVSWFLIKAFHKSKSFLLMINISNQFHFTLCWLRALCSAGINRNALWIKCCDNTAAEGTQHVVEKHAHVCWRSCYCPYFLCVYASSQAAKSFQWHPETQSPESCENHIIITCFPREISPIPRKLMTVLCPAAQSWI